MTVHNQQYGLMSANSYNNLLLWSNAKNGSETGNKNYNNISTLPSYLTVRGAQISWIEHLFPLQW